ncbi:MAG: NUDIX domain-containing protein [Rectinema sp.]
MEKTKQQSEASQTSREPFAIMASSELPIIDIDNNGCSDEYIRSLEEKTAHALERLGGIGAAASAFHFCPSCGSPKLYSVRSRMWKCPTCGFEYFHNVATAAGVIIEAKNKIIMIRRHKDPMRGRFALPGGFTEPGERAEDAALRECYEEIGWSPTHINFLATFPNVYQYQGIPYATCDVYFYSRGNIVEIDDFHLDPEESDSVQFVAADAIPWANIAFESTIRALRYFILHESIGTPPRLPEFGAIE